MTFDVLMERAVDEARFDGQRQTRPRTRPATVRIPSGVRSAGLPRGVPPLGRLSGTPHSFAVTREDTLEFMESLLSRPPGFLFDKLRESDLLILGSRFSEWLARHLAQGEGMEAPVLFVERAKGTTEALSAGSAVELVRELSRRFREFSPQEEAAPPSIAFSSGMPSGAVFLSCAGEDGARRSDSRHSTARVSTSSSIYDDAPRAQVRRGSRALGPCSSSSPSFPPRSLKARDASCRERGSRPF
jgi:hypothetical protein